MIYLALSHDVDRTKKTFQFLTHLMKARSLSNFKYQVKSLFLKDHYWGFEKIIELENKYNVKSTFFFLNESIPFKPFQISNWKLSVGYYNMLNQRIQEVIKDLDKNGWEIGLHGSFLSYKDLILLQKEKEDLESIVSHKIQGIRQHFLNLNENTWHIQKQAGFSYDASFGFTRDVGFKDNIYIPFSPNNMKDFIVIPLAIMDFCLIKQEKPIERAIEIINEADKNNGLLVLNWHQRTFNKEEFPGYSELYESIIIECLKRNAIIGPINEVLDKMKIN